MRRTPEQDLERRRGAFNLLLYNNIEFLGSPHNAHWTWRMHIREGEGNAVDKAKAEKNKSTRCGWRNGFYIFQLSILAKLRTVCKVFEGRKQFDGEFIVLIT